MTSLGAFAGVTIVTPDLDHSVAAYAAAFGYHPRQPESTVGQATAQAWGCPEAAGCRVRQLYPESGEARFLRFVESDTPAGYRPMSTFGWNAVELVVQDLDALHTKLLAQPAFEVIGPPRVLDFDFTDQISAMQVRGPSGEVLYLTEIKAEIPGFELPAALSFVGCPFVAILGTPAIEPTAAWYAATLSRQAMPAFHARVEVLSAAHGLPLDLRHRLTTLALPERSLIEIDDFPVASSTRRPLSRCGLPMAIAMASFFVEADEADGADETPAPRVCHGAAGEWLELLPSGG